MPAPTLRVLVTRPEREAQHWVTALQTHGIAAQALPLMAITAPADTATLHAARQRLAEYHAVMVVSGNAAQHFFEPHLGPNLGLNTAQTLIQPALAAIKTRAWAPGPGTAKILQSLGFDAARIDQPAPDAAQFDSEALWAQVQGQIKPGMRVLIVRGTDAALGSVPAKGAGAGRDWLTHQLEATGAQVDFVVAYTRGAPVWTNAQRTLAQEAACDGSLWLLSSSQALAYLGAALPAQCWGQARALATHPRIAQAARAAGFGSVGECRPALKDVVASIELPP